MTTGRQVSQVDNVYLLPVLGKYLLYAPFHDFAALLNRAAVRQLRDGLSAGGSVGAGPLRQVLQILQAEAAAVPARKEGPLAPEFLGLIPTRACNLTCAYCGFWAAEGSKTAMSLELARAAVDWYLDLVGRAGRREAEIHFFGGEPFCAAEVIDVAVYHARARAREGGITLRFEVATNGTFNQSRCQWVADHLDTVVLSLDGPAEVHDRHRPFGRLRAGPFRGGQGSFEVVARNAATLSEGATELCLRACVTSDTVDRMEEIADWFCQAFRPQSVCFETLQPTAQSGAAGLCPPDPWRFAHNFIKAARVLESLGVEPVYAAADIHSRRISFCPVAQDVAIVSPDGLIAACYLLQRDWEAKDLDMRMGRMGAGGAIKLDMGAVEAIRDMNVLNRPACDACFCRWHCAGGCHVDHSPCGPPGAYDRLCIQTRAITLSNILKRMDQEQLLWDLLENPAALEVAVWQPADRIRDWDEGYDRAGT